MTAWKYVVLDDEDKQSRNRNGDSETFNSYGAAHKRAIELAEDTPGDEVKICEQVAFVKQPLGTIETVRKRQIQDS